MWNRGEVNSVCDRRRDKSDRARAKPGRPQGKPERPRQKPGRPHVRGAQGSSRTWPRTPSICGGPISRVG